MFKDNNLCTPIVHICSPFGIQIRKVISQGWGNSSLRVLATRPCYLPYQTVNDIHQPSAEFSSTNTIRVISETLYQ